MPIQEVELIQQASMSNKHTEVDEAGVVRHTLDALCIKDDGLGTLVF